MKGVIQTGQLRNALGKILSVVENKAARPNLAYALIEADGESFSISATNVEVSSKVIVDGRIDDGGRFCVDAKKLSDILREMPEGSVEMNLKDNSLGIKKDGIFYSLLTHAGDHFPRLSFERREKGFSLRVGQIQDIIAKISHAISVDETRGVQLNGIYLSQLDGKLRGVATDGHRFAMIDTDIEWKGPDDLQDGIIIPKKGVSELKKMTEYDKDTMVFLSVEDGSLHASVDDGYFINIRLVPREYPNYKNIIPEKSAFTVGVDKTSLIDAVRRIKIMSNEKSHGVKILLGHGEMQISTNNPVLGNASEKIPVEFDKEDVEIGFNARYLMDSLSVFNEGSVEIKFDNSTLPVVLKSPVLPNYLGIVMPFKIIKCKDRQKGESLR